MNVAVIGCGYWGRHIVRNFNNSQKWNLKYICDLDAEKLNNFAAQYRNAKATNNPEDIFLDNSIDAVAIATPVFSHFELAKNSLLSGKHTWVEKPLTASSAEAAELCEIAEKMNVLLHVDHTFIYTPAVQKIKEIISNGDLGNFLYFDSVRVNLGLFQHDVNVLWDLSPHDISILEYVIGKKPESVNAVGKSVIKYSGKSLENIAYLTVNFADDTIAHFHANWLSPVKIRQIMIAGDKKMLVFDDMAASEKIKIYDSGVNIKNNEDIYDALIQYRTGDMHSPAIRNDEALAVEVDHFFDCIQNNQKTKTSGESGLYVVKILEAANLSLAKNGEQVKL